MQAVREITVWDWEFQPNHTYLLDGDKMIAYIPKGQSTPHYFKTLMRLNKRGRKFMELTQNPFVVPEDTKKTIKVQGSKGNTYEVDPVNETCDCPGFMYRGKCRHLDEILTNTKT